MERVPSSLLFSHLHCLDLLSCLHSHPLYLIDTKQYSADVHQQLATHCPSLATALVHIPDGKIPQEVLDILVAAIAVVTKTYPNSNFSASTPPSVTHIPTSITDDDDDSAPLLPKSTTASQVEGQALPEPPSVLSRMKWSWPKLRALPWWEVDPAPKTKVVAEWNDPVATSAETELFCLKEEVRGYATQKHTAGLFVGCCLHAVCYG